MQQVLKQNLHAKPLIPSYAIQFDRRSFAIQFAGWVGASGICLCGANLGCGVGLKGLYNYDN